MSIRYLIYCILVYLFAPKKQEPVRLHKQPSKFEWDVNWTFILIALAVTGFFIILFMMMLNGVTGVESGNYYYHL